MNWILARLQEGSSYNGAAAFLAGALGIHLSADFVTQAAAAGVALFGFVAFVIKDKGAKA